MQLKEGQTAFVTGGASGIGLGMAEAFGRRGLNVMIADIEELALGVAVEALREKGVDAAGLVLDVADRKSVEAAAAETVSRFGAVHLVCNNAGVAVAAPVGQIPPGDWDWIIDVNLKGVVHGVEAFLPHLLAQGEGHIVNTASMAGLVGMETFEPYVATKYAVVGMSEGWAAQLEPTGVGMSVLCPGFVRTRILDSRRNRASAYGAAPEQVALFDEETAQAALDGAMSPELIGERVVEAVEAGEFYILTHLEYQPDIDKRFQAMLAAFDRSAQSPILARRPAQSFPQIMIQEMHAPTQLQGAAQAEAAR